jgi:hypothetical protein
MAYFDLNAWTKDTVNGLNETIFTILSESGAYSYTASSGEPTDTGSAIIYMDIIESFPTISTIDGSGSFDEITSERVVEGYTFTSEYIFLDGTDPTKGNIPVSSSFVGFTSASLPLNS